MDNKSYSKGISWIDDCRIPHNEACKEMKKQDVINSIYGQGGRHADVLELKPQGRFPANILVSDDMLNDGVYHKTGIASIPKGKKVYGRNSLLESKTEDYGGKFGALNEKGGSNSRYYDIDKWFEKLLND